MGLGRKIHEEDGPGVREEWAERSREPFLALYLSPPPKKSETPAQWLPGLSVTQNLKRGCESPTWKVQSYHLSPVFILPIPNP